MHSLNRCFTMFLISLTAQFVTACGLSAAEPATKDESFSRWKTNIEKMKQDPSLVRLYLFEEGDGLLSRNRLDASAFSELTISVNDYFANKAPQDYPRWAEGRWAGKAALSIGTAVNSIGRTHFYGVDGKDFSVETWVRLHPSPADKSRAVFVSVGDAWSVGWRLEADRTGVRFILGRTQGEGEGKGIVTAATQKALTPQVWHHLAGVLNGKKLLLYVDGALAAEKDFDGVYQHVKAPASSYLTPELDFGGLLLGTTKSQVSSSRFDIDELALYSRPLEAARIASDYNDGKPGMSADEQIRRHQAALARETQLTGIAIDLPRESFGYFPNNQPIPLTVSVAGESTALFGDKASVNIAVKKFQVETISSTVENLPLTRGTPARYERLIQPGPCGLYELTVTLNGGDGKTVKSAVLPFAVRVPLPARKDISDTSMLAGYYCVNDETPTFGTKIERIIQPIYGRAKDGTPNYASSDAFVEKCGSMGLDILYCIGIGFWDAGKYPTIAEWQANPAFHQEHLRNLVTRYKGKVKYWEILNEPNSGHSQGMTAAIYVKFLKEAYDIIKGIDPEAKVVGPCGTSNYQEWTEEVLAAGGGEYLDILSFHNYIGASPIENCFNAGRVESVKASMRKHIGKLLPMWNSECGLHQPARIAGRPATDDELLKIYGGRASRVGDVVKVGVDAIMMVNEHRSACWQVQSVLMEMVQGVEKFFMLMRPSLPYPTSQPFPGGAQMLTEKGVALAAMQSVIINAVSTRLV
ncbi:MAG: LamG-like jellyroll fold domain-containing protein, partial [Victivallales bacterium]